MDGCKGCSQFTIFRFDVQFYVKVQVVLGLLLFTFIQSNLYNLYSFLKCVLIGLELSCHEQVVVLPDNFVLQTESCLTYTITPIAPV